MKNDHVKSSRLNHIKSKRECNKFVFVFIKYSINIPNYKFNINITNETTGKTRLFWDCREKQMPRLPTHPTICI